MIGRYKGLIPENIAPKGVTTIGVYDSDNEKRTSIFVPSWMRYPEETPLYSFGIFADTHITTSETPASKAEEDLRLALDYLRNKGVSLVCMAGDVTNEGFYVDTLVDGNHEYLYNPVQFEKYKKIREDYQDAFPIYMAAGNHESMYSKAITTHIAEYEEYTGHGLYFSVLQNDDVFIFIGQPHGSAILNTEELTWLQQQLVTYKDNRCFVFVHPFVDSGNPLGVRENDIFSWATNDGVRNTFLSALKNHGRLILFHGHSHMKLECQDDDETSNYNNKYGFHSVHVPSCAVPRIVTYPDGVPTSTDVVKGSQFYYVEVFDDYIILNGMDIGIEDNDRTPILIPQGIIRIDTSIVK